MRLKLAFIVLCLYVVDLRAVDYHNTDIFGSVGADFTLAPRFNGMVGIGRRFHMKKDCETFVPTSHHADLILVEPSYSSCKESKARWEVTGTYSYENNGNHGFLKTQFASHTEAIGLVRSFHMPGRFTSFATTHTGITEFSGMSRDPRPFVNIGGGFGMHIAYRYTLTVTELFTKTETRPTYFTTGIGFNHGWWSVTANYNRTSGDYKCHVNFGISLSALKTGEHKEHPRIVHVASVR
jgi:hypothetical protein